MDKALDINSPILVIGATNGLGLAILKTLARKGYMKLFFTSRSQQNIEQAHRTLGLSIEQKAKGVIFDQSNKASIDDLFTFFKQRGEFPELVICTVGVNLAHSQGFKKLHSLNYERLQSTVTTNITHTLYLLSLFIPELKKLANPHIVLIGSLAYEHGIKGQIAYNSCKASMVGIHNSLCMEYPKIASYLFEPGIVDNPRIADYKSRLESSGIAIEKEQDAVDRMFSLMGWQ